MKIVHWLCLSLLLLTGMSSRTWADTFRTDINPAMLYYQAFLMEPHLTDADHDYVFTNHWQGQPLPEHLDPLISRYDTEMKYLHRAAAQTLPCDWGIDMSPGPETLLPELAYCKRAAQMSRLEAMRDLEKGDEAGACDALLGALAVGRNSSRDGTLIAVLVQIAIEHIVVSTVAENFNHFSAQSLHDLADGFATAAKRRTVGDTLTGERFTSGRWLNARIREMQKAHPGDEAAVMADLQRTVERVDYEDETNYWQRLSSSAGGTVAGMIKLTVDSEDFADRLAPILALPHGEFEDQYKQYSEEVRKSGNYLSADALPAWPASRRKEFTVQAELAMLQAAIAYKLHGEDGLKGVNDPFGNGPFTMKRFIFQGEDRGFQLTSAYIPLKTPEKLIFVEKDGPPFYVFGSDLGKPVTP